MTMKIERISRCLIITLASLAILAAAAFPFPRPGLGDSGANETTDLTQVQEPPQSAESDTPNYSGASNYSDDAQSESSKRTSPPAVQGTWCGPMNDNHFGLANISMDISQRGSKLSGTWTSSLGRSGTLKGKIAGSAVSLTLQEKDNVCRAAVNGTLVQSDEITGNYTIFGCHQSDGGTFDMTSPDC